MSTSTQLRSPRPWYKEPWTWGLMFGPFVVVIASFITAWIAAKSNDGLVTEDYYKQGLAVAETIAQSRLAQEKGIEARLKLTADRIEVRLSSATELDSQPGALRLSLSHPTRAGLDQEVVLAPSGEGKYAGGIRLPATGHWIVLVEDSAQTWRLLGNVVLPALGEVVIGGGEPAGKGS